MKNFYKIPRAQLAVEAIAAANAIANGKVSGFSPAQSAALAAEVLVAAERLQTKDEAAVQQKAASISATDQAQEAKDQLAKLMSAVKYSMRGVDASPDEFDAVGIKPPADSRTAVTPHTPTGLSAYGRNGFVDLAWRSSNDSGEVTFIIFERSHRNDDWSIIGMSTAQKFRHEGVPPGEFHQYQIKAQASGGRLSPWSNTAVVYDLKR